MKRLFVPTLFAVLALLLCGILSMKADAATEGYYTYEVSDGEATITDCDTSISGDITIPSTLGGYPVTSIGYRAFYDCVSLTSATIPDSVISIGIDAFRRCRSLISISIPDSVTSIGSSAFRSCRMLSNITLPSNVTSIGNYAFASCYSLISITIPDSIISIGEHMFFDCNSLANITIPDSVTSIGDYAFDDCDGLTNIILPNSVTSIGNYAFQHCASLTSIAIPNSIINIGSKAFYGCSKLEYNKYDNAEYLGNSQNQYVVLIESVSNDITSCIIHNAVKIINRDAFSGCENLTNIAIPDSVTGIGHYAFSGCSSLTSITFGEESELTGIGEYAFLSCSNLTSITVPDSVTSIGGSAFSGCSNLNSITLPFVGDSRTNGHPFGYIFGSSSYSGGMATRQYYYTQAGSSLTTGTYYIPASLKTARITDGNILRGAFENCSNLTSITVSENITFIGDCAFSGCTGLTNFNIPSGVTTIGSGAFDYCYNMTDVTIPTSVITIGDAAFYRTGLINLIIPNSVTCIGSYAFYECDKLTSLTLSDGIKTIGEDAFTYSPIKKITIAKGSQTITSSMIVHNYNLEEVVIPCSVTTIEDYAFQGCSALTELFIPDSVTSIGKGAFYNCTGLLNIAIPNSVNAIGDYAFGFCESLKSIALPNQITTISDAMFLHCYALKEITIPKSVVTIGGSAFSESGLQKIEIPNNVTEIRESAFAWCSELSRVTLPDKIATIGKYAFSYCDRLSTITIPASLTSIGNDTFCGCNKLLDVYFLGTNTQWEQLSANNNIALLHEVIVHIEEIRFIAPTCTEQGYTLHICTCGDSYKDAFLDALGHDIENFICSVCGCEIVNLAITAVTLRPSVAGVYFTGTFRVEEGVTVVRKGIAVSVYNSMPVADGSDSQSLCSEGTTSVLVTNILNAKYDDNSNAMRAVMPIYARAYVELSDGTYIYSDVVAVKLREVTEVVDAEWSTLDDVQKAAITAMYVKFKTILDAWDLTNIGNLSVEPTADVLMISGTQTISNQTIDTDVYITSTGVATFNNVTINGNIYCYGQLKASGCVANDVYAYAYGSMMSCDAFDGTYGKVSGGISCNGLTIQDDALEYAFSKWGKQ